MAASQQDRDIYVIINAYWGDLNFQIQEGSVNDWTRVVDTSMPSPFDLLRNWKRKTSQV